MVNPNSFSHNKPSFEVEKQQVQRALQQVLTERQIWMPVASEWFAKWKLYVNYDGNFPEPRDAQEVESFHPGPIDNSSLKGSFGDELRRDIVESKDYVLLPKNVAEMLFEKYGGGPKFPRESVNVGSLYQPLIQVNLFPVRFEVYLCDKTHPTPIRDLKSHFLIRYYTKNMLMDKVIDDLKGQLANDYWTSVRCWVKDTRTNSLNSSGINTSTVTEGNDGEETSSAKRQKGSVGRMLTADVVEWDEDWRYSPNIQTQKVNEVVGTKEFVELILEAGPGRSTGGTKDSEWPRFKFLEAWKNELRKGDLIDCMDKTKYWYEAMVKDVDVTGKLYVHFKGWGDDFDEIILPEMKMTRVKPLHSESDDRQRWEEGNSVELKISLGGTNHWLPVTIISKDIQNDRIQVKYLRKERISALKNIKKAQEKKKKTQSGQSSATGSAMDDDSLKRKSITSVDDDDNNSNDHNNSEEKDETAMDEEKMDGNEVIKEWHALYSDEICAMYTHTKKEKTPYSPYSSYSTPGTSYMSSNYSSGYNRYRYDYEKNTRGAPQTNGVVGLQNLGNTCFMNSILQCLSNTQVLTNFFLNEDYKEQINYDNPLGNNGKVALSYGKLAKEIWSNSYTLVIPRDFKNTIGEFRPQFAGYEQQDSQEFMNFLLDGLHEDLNRVHKKPHVAKIESKSRPDEMISAESWRRFLLRNDSRLVDEFFGQLKSHVTCVNCKNVSVTFDEYSSVSLPIPIKNTKTFDILVQLLPVGTPPMKIRIEVEVTEPMTSLKKVIVDKLASLDIQLVSGSNGSTSPSPVHKSGSVENGFEMVTKMETEEEFQVVNAVKEGEENNNSTSEPMEVESKKANTATAGDGIYFHFALLFSNRANIYKNYHSDDHGATAISSFIGRMEVLIAFQLEFPAAEPKPYASYSYSSSYTNSSYYGHNQQKKEEEKNPNEAFYVIDVQHATKTPYDRLELTGYPTRIAFNRSKENFTNHDVHLLIRKMIRRVISDEADPNLLSAPWPYDLCVTSSYATNIRRNIEDNMEAFEHLNENNDLLVIAWHKKALDEGFLNMDELKLVREIDPAIAHSSSTGKKSGGMSSIYDDDEESSSSKEGKRITIYDCLDKFIEREQLNETETLYCSKCKQHLAPIKKMDVYSAPDVLILHLKRFQFIPGQYFVHREKIVDLIDFPIEGLDLTKYVIGPKSEENPPIYDLYGVSHHMGGLGGGHYIATCKNFMDGKWYKFNDSSVNEINESSIVSGTAYVLFYKRRSGSLKWGGIVPSQVPIPDED